MVYPVESFFRLHGVGVITLVYDQHPGRLQRSPYPIPADPLISIPRRDELFCQAGWEKQFLALDDRIALLQFFQFPLHEDFFALDPHPQQARDGRFWDSGFDAVQDLLLASVQDLQSLIKEIHNIAITSFICRTCLHRKAHKPVKGPPQAEQPGICHLYTSDAADEL